MGTTHNITPAEKSQEALSLREIAADRKAAARVMSRLLWQAGFPEEADTMAQCGDNILLRHYEDGSEDVAAALYCKHRLCPTCQWRRSRKAAGQLSAIMDYMDAQRVQAKGKPWAWIALSYSPQNVWIEDVGDRLDRMQKSFGRLMRKAPLSVAAGAVRCIEVRRSDGAHNPAWKGSYQVHIHSLLAVPPSYFTSRAYISRERWGELLHECLDFMPWIPLQYYVERVDKKSGRMEGTAAETAKYITKFDLPYYAEPGQGYKDSPDLYGLAMLNIELRGRHMIQYYGDMRKARQALFAPEDDPDNPRADLSDILPTRPDLAYTLVALHYQMGVGYIPVKLPPKNILWKIYRSREDGASENLAADLRQAGIEATTRGDMILRIHKGLELPADRLR